MNKFTCYMVSHATAHTHLPLHKGIIAFCYFNE